MNRSRQYYLLALFLGLLFHGTIMAFTMENTYDAYVHMFFAEHYANDWFESWNYKWYTGFTMTSYPPLVHHVVAQLSKFVGLKIGFIIWGLVAIALFIRGTYYFSKLWVNDVSAGYAAILAVLSSSYVEALHIFGQLPSITGAALLLNACPELYKWIRYKRHSYFFTGISIIACLTAAHHVTTIFGMVFFIAPTLGVAVLDLVIEEKGGIKNVRVMDFIKKVWRLSPKAILVGVTVITLTVFMIFPYWYWSSTDPITQVSIPHGSRASFIEEPSLGLVFFLIPWGIMLLFLPAILSRILKKRNIFLGLSFCLLFVLGTGGTTPIPIMLLGENAFNILTLDRFTFWASIIAIPFFADVMRSFVEGNLGNFIKDKFSTPIHRVAIFGTIIAILLIDGLVINLSNFRPLQPDKIEIKPITNFLSRDGHDRWRYMTLGFGDQMAWLSANTQALSLDGNYHSARRLPEMTTRAVERIENSKYLGDEGIGALRQFLTLPEKFNLKYIFSNDKFYEPVLFFYGWTKLKPLENNIDIWERKDVPPLPSILPKKVIPKIQRLMWGILPLASLCLAFFLNLLFRGLRNEDRFNIKVPNYSSSKWLYVFYAFWFLLIFTWSLYQFYKVKKNSDSSKDPIELIHAYFHAIDFKYFDEAFELLDEKSRISRDQFMLELSLEDGILASYAKLDSLAIKEERDISKSKKEVLVEAHWLTAVQEYSTSHKLILIQNYGSWSIQKDVFERDVPQDQFLRIPDVDFFNQGRRQAISGTTAKEDVLDRPEVYLREAQLVKKDSQVYVVGEIINIDVDPAFVTAEAVLYANNKEQLRFSVNETIIHNLMPKESSYFRIDFQELIDQLKFDGHEIDIEAIDDCVVFVRSTVTDEKCYKYYGLKDLIKTDSTISGSFINYGNREVSIPQILWANRKDGKITWVDRAYIDRGVRPQREKPFSFNIENEPRSILIKSCTKDKLIVNGVTMEVVDKYLPSYFHLNTNDQYLREGVIANGLTGLTNE